MAASAGEPVYIRGTNLSYTNVVTFGGRYAAGFTIVSDTLLIAQPGTGLSGMLGVSGTVGFSYLPGFVYLPNPQILSCDPMTGGYGDTVTIKGRNLFSTDRVLFNDSIALSFTVLSDTVLKAVVGNGRSGWVAVATTAAQIPSWIYGFTHLGPEIISFTPRTGVTGDIITIKGKNFTGASEVKFGGYNAASFIQQGDTMIIATLGQVGPGTVSVKTSKGTIVEPGFLTAIIYSFTPASAYRGATVSITGTNFTGVTAVKFGDTLVSSFTIVNDGRLDAVVGDGASGKIKLFKGVDSFSSWNNFTYLPYRPDITGFSPSTATHNDTLTLTGIRFLRASAVHIGRTPAASFEIISDTQIKAVVAKDSDLSDYVRVTNDGLSDSLSGFSYFYLPPNIISFSPMSGPAGTSVVLKGTHFGPAITDNVVHFGALSAVITQVTDSSITVTVPPNASQQLISVTHSAMTGYTSVPFNPTVNDGVRTLTDSSFNLPLHITNPAGSNPHKVVHGDFDGDGKTDLAVVCGFSPTDTTNNYVSIFRNTTTGDFISFAAPVNIAIGRSGMSTNYDVAVADIDGDGMLDLVTSCGKDNNVSILKNTSTPGNLSFAEKVSFNMIFQVPASAILPLNIAVADMDKDGKPDVVVSRFGGVFAGNMVSWLRNTTRNGIFSFTFYEGFTGLPFWKVYAADLNNDRKPEIAVPLYEGLASDPQMFLYKNTSAQKNISLSGSRLGPENRPPVAVFVGFGDIDGDGKTDLVSSNADGYISVFRNTSTDGGNINFAAPVNYFISYSISTFTLGDLTISDVDGDGKNDIIVSAKVKDSIYILKNTSAPGSISLASAIGYKTGSLPIGVIAANLDGDGRPDIVTANSGNGSITILRNRIAAPLRLCPPMANANISAGITGNNFQWQVDRNDGNGFVNINNGIYYSGTNTANLQLVNIPSSFNGYQYRCIADAAVYGNAVQVEFYNQWTGSVNSLWSNAANWSCGVLPDANTTVSISSGNIIVDVHASCYSITLLPPATVTVNPGVILTVTH